jgi:two-component system NtrC family sensor kinase
MLPIKTGIRQKIVLGYYGILLIILGFSAFSYAVLKYIEEKVILSNVIAEFFDTTLEMRRFEKNFFLYHQQADLAENLHYVEKALATLSSNLGGVATVVSGVGDVETLRDSFVQYQALMRQHASNMQEAWLEQKIRDAGKGIVTIAERVAGTERKNIKTMLHTVRQRIIFLMIGLVGFGVMIGQILSRIVVRPLKQLENSMAIIAQGGFDTISIHSCDSEIVSLTAAFNKMLKELEIRQRHIMRSEKLASLGTLLAGVAHELNNPLSNISTSCQILIEEITDPDTAYKHELLSQIEDQADRARNIIRSLLEFSREKAFTKESCSVKSLLAETIQFTKGQIPTPVTISLDIPDDLYLFVDKQRLQQAFLNLLKNAIESIDGEGTVTIRARHQKAIDKIEDNGEIYNYLKYRGKCTLEDDTIDIEIADTGAGISPEVAAKIFDPFFTTKDVGKGSGFGLSIVHEIIEEHDGCIAIDSKVGEGTRFFIRLPAKGTA